MRRDHSTSPYERSPSNRSYITKPSNLLPLPLDGFDQWLRFSFRPACPGRRRSCQAEAGKCQPVATPKQRSRFCRNWGRVWRQRNAVRILPRTSGSQCRQSDRGNTPAIPQSLTIDAKPAQSQQESQSYLRNRCTNFTSSPASRQCNSVNGQRCERSSAGEPRQLLPISLSRMARASVARRPKI